ncbi:PaaX family transcriptional regulator C-terminal domain-containing protein [Roseibium aggregatum]|uniref:PaaX family transcriptional regulator n=1 Tax=Roseibium aggregatum TaxID=187304 RepID=A0A939EE66_9HYPH|nr:PaaX family transcriptional regulator C-terminal domain-containing protein [Roseibium aggregatum]MBN9670493.1 PaaX family transcriptional regulator [Roseibium aggregatum]
MPPSIELTIDRFVSPNPPKATHLIATIYGDVVEPRGGSIWMGDLISLCAGFAVNESLARRAVSRLVSQGQLVGYREGRRSFYALTPEAGTEYRHAAEVLYGEEDGESEWIIAHCPEWKAQEDLRRQGFVSLGGDVFVGSDRPGRRIGGTAFRASPLEPESEALKALAFDAYDLETLSRDYAAFIRQFEPLKTQFPKKLAGAPALVYRVALVHAYRAVRLRDPRLPVSVLPVEWPGTVARALFCELYRALSGAADEYICRHFLNRDGPMERTTEAVSARLKSLEPLR